MAEIIAIGSLVFAVAFGVAWLLQPDFRAWVEGPKYRFDDNLRRYDDRQKPHD
jgi:hypothetical protein